MSALFSDRRCLGNHWSETNRWAHLRSFRPGWKDSDRDSSEKGIGGMALVVTEKGDCDVYNSPDHGTPYVAEGRGFP